VVAGREACTGIYFALFKRRHPVRERIAERCESQLFDGAPFFDQQQRCSFLAPHFLRRTLIPGVCASCGCVLGGGRSLGRSAGLLRWLKAC
jgi:hypothetical protein